MPSPGPTAPLDEPTTGLSAGRAPGAPARRPVRRTLGRAPIALAGIAVGALAACESGMRAIDQRTVELLRESSEKTNVQVDPEWPRPSVPEGAKWPQFGPDPINIATRNPNAAEMPFTVRKDEAALVLERVTAEQSPATAIVFNLEQAVSYAVANGREYQDAAETYVLSALQLLIERHRWGPRFFDDIRANVQSTADNGVYNASLNLMNDFTVRQRLPYGGEVTASLLASAVENLHNYVAGDNVQSAEIILAAQLPLLRGAGLAAREDLIQAERNLIYAARDFERFRREFVFEISRDFLDLVVDKQAIDNAQRQLESFIAAEAREIALFKAGREAGFQAGLAAQNTLFARNNLARLEESFRLAVDRFKVRLGMPTEQPLAIDTSTLGLPSPQVAMDEAVAVGLAYRLDLQNERDQFEDARRRVDVARNRILPDLNLTGGVNVPTDPSIQRGGLQFDGNETQFTAGLLLSLPLDRDIERAQLREAQIVLEQAGRRYSRARDDVAVEVRNAVRQIDRALFSIKVQEENVRIARLREASIDAAPDRASARDRSDAIEARLAAEDGLAQAKRDLQVAILGYLVSTGQLRVGPKGDILPLNGMALRPTGTPGGSPRASPDAPAGS
ncbi:MAG: TolC family protein [Phycisphaerales bacterium]